MGLPELEKCCFVFDLKTGNIILGCLNAVLSFYLLVVMIIAAATVGVLDTEVENELQDAELQAQVTGLYVMCIILVLMFLAKFCFDIAFIYAVVKGRAGIIKAYFILLIVFFLLSTFIFLFKSPSLDAGTIVTQVFYTGLNIYVILLSYSFYRQLNSREEI